MEGLSKSALIKSLTPRVILSNHVLVKGTKMRVNLEDQSRQKVSFTFSQIKKPLQSPFFVPASQDASVTEPHGALSQSTLDRAGRSTDSSKAEQKETLSPTSSTAETPPQTVASSTRLKTNLTKMHFKKQILSVSVIEEKPTSAESEEPHTSESKPLLKSESKSESEFPVPQPQNVISICPAENTHTEASETIGNSILKKPAASSGKDHDSSSSTEQDNVYKRITRSQSDSAPQCSESEGDLVHMSSRRKSVDSKSKTDSDSRGKEVKKSSSSSRNGDKEKNSFKRSDNYERSSSYSKSDREPRNTSSRSSRSDKDRRRSRSRSRSRSRGSRTSSSHSRSERYRSDRGSRSERSYYHDSDRRSHRTSPRRERRRSRSRTDRTRDSSDSEDDHRKTRTRTSDSSRLSYHSSSHRESKSSSFSKSERASKSVDSPHSSEFDKRLQPSKSERTSKRSSDSDSQRKCSPDLDSTYRKTSGHHKSETNNKSPSFNTPTQSHAHDKHRKSSSTDSEGDHKGKLQTSDKNDSLENCKDSEKKTSSSESKPVTPSRPSAKSPGHDRESGEIFHSPGKAPSCAGATEFCSQSDKEKSNSPLCENKHIDKEVKVVALPANKILEESLSKKEQETKSEFEKENETASATTSESVAHVNVPLDDFSTMKGMFSSTNQPHINFSDTEKCDDGVICKQDETFLDSSPETKSSLDIVATPVTHDVQQNTKSEIIEPTEVLIDDKESVTVPVKSDSPCLESENQKQEQQNVDVKKSCCATRKSRWDIVGQDTPESDNSHKAVCAESKFTVKKVISVKKINVSKDNSQQDSEIKEEAATHSKLINQTESSKQEVCSDSIFVTPKYNDQSEPPQASTSVDHCDSKLSASQKSNTDEPLQMDDTPQIDSPSKIQSQQGDDCEDKSKESTHISKLNKRTSVRQDALGRQSEASDSDNSEYDSDCDKAIKQLHSVVVVPKNSSITKDVEDRGTSANNSELISAHVIADVNYPNQVNSQQTQSIEKTGLNGSLGSSVLCQSQSNMVDSTSHSESSGSLSSQTFVAGLVSAHESASDSTHMLDNSRNFDHGFKQHEMSNRSEQSYSHYQHNDFSSADNVSGKNGFSLGWDFSELPTSTCQQPDSSHGPQLMNTKLTGAISNGPEQRHTIASCTQQSPNVQSGKKPYLHVHEHYQEPSSEIHPDSLTNDHDDYSGDKSSSKLGKTAVECSVFNASGSSSFVQGHEISSNSRGSTVPDPSREDNFRPHRARGPPKKRRPEVESDSDNEAEAGPSSKRERQGEAVASKSPVKAEVHRTSLTLQDFQDANKWKDFAKTKKMPPYFDLIEENLYLTER